MAATGWGTFCRAAKLCLCPDQRRSRKETAEVAFSASSGPNVTAKTSPVLEILHLNA